MLHLGPFPCHELRHYHVKYTSNLKRNIYLWRLQDNVVLLQREEILSS